LTNILTGEISFGKSPLLRNNLREKDFVVP